MENNETKIVSGQGVMETTKEGASRESNEGRGRFDLLPYEAIEALAKWYEAGAKKYADRNWEKGLSVKDCINRMIRHSIKAGNGWTDEDHLAAVMWNAAAAITMIKRRPDCNDHPWKDSVDELKQIVNSVYGGKSATTTIVDEEAFKCLVPVMPHCPICLKEMKLVDDGDSCKHLECSDCNVTKKFSTWAEQKTYEDLMKK